jgi:hypothetical protein
MKYFFFGLIFTAFGTGVTLSQMVGERLTNGFWFLGLGFLLLLISALTRELQK